MHMNVAPAVEHPREALSQPARPARSSPPCLRWAVAPSAAAVLHRFELRAEIARGVSREGLAPGQSRVEQRLIADLRLANGLDAVPPGLEHRAKGIA